MKRSRVRVSDHALIRYLERVGGFEIERLRIEIARRVEAGVAAGACGVGGGGWADRGQEDAHGPVVTTVIAADWGVRNHERGGPGKGGAGE